MYVFLPSWPVDRLRRTNSISRFPCNAPADESPFATVTASGGRRLLAALNPAAAKAGLAPGMPLPDALSFVPGLMTVPADPAADSAALTRLAEWCGRYSPWTAPDDSDGVKIEITGSAHLWGGEAALVADISRRLSRQHIAHRIAIASTLGAAWGLARHAAADGQPALPGPENERAALAPLPVEALRLDPNTVQGLRRVGLRHVGELYPMPRDALARRFGDAVARRLDQAFGDLPEPLSPLGETPSRRVRLSFAEPIADPADLARATERLVDDLAARLAREGMGARQLALGFHRVDGRVEHIRLGTARPSRDPRHLAKLFAEKLDTIDPGLGVEDMILAVFAVEKLEPEQTELAGGNPGAAPHEIASLLDRLGNRFGLDALSHIEPRASHIPERASIHVPIDGKRSSEPSVIPGRRAAASPESMNTSLWKMDSGPAPMARPGMTSGEVARESLQFATGEANSLSSIAPIKSSPASGGGSPRRSRGQVGASSAKPPRPVRLFRPPEPVEAQWVLPDDPPFRFTWRRRHYRVLHADGPERIAEEWWRADGAADPRDSGDHIRDYYRVEDEEGRRFWLYRAGLPGDPPPRWFVHGIFA
jgi:protein ImuB